jgi:hypothetical protein
MRHLKIWHMGNQPLHALQALTQLHSLSFWHADIQGVSGLAQLTGLTQLSMDFSTVTFPAAAQSQLGSVLLALSKLKSLRISHVPPGPVAEALASMTQLKSLTFHSEDTHIVESLAPLTGLTHLDLGYTRTPFPAAAQSQLGSVLLALSKLQSLRVSHVPPGPVAEALASMTSLTELKLSDQGLVQEPGPVVLPSVRSLSVGGWPTTTHLLCITALNLQHLTAELLWRSGDEKDLRRLCRGLLRVCNKLELKFRSSNSKKEAVAMMSVLGRGWRPTSIAEGWELSIYGGCISHLCLSLLPKGITRLFIG